MEGDDSLQPQSDSHPPPTPIPSLLPGTGDIPYSEHFVNEVSAQHGEDHVGPGVERVLQHERGVVNGKDIYHITLQSSRVVIHKVAPWRGRGGGEGRGESEG